MRPRRRRIAHQLSKGASTARRSGNRESGSTSSTRSAASGPAAARAWRIASRRRAARAAAGSSSSGRWSEASGPKRSTASLSYLRRRRHQRQVRHQRQPHAHRIGQRLAEHHLLAPRPALLDQLGGDDDRSQRPPAPLPASQQAIDQQAQPPLQLDPGRRLGQLERLAQELARRAGAERAVTAPRQLIGEQPPLAEAIGQRGGGQRRQLAERPDPSRSSASGRSASAGRARSSATGQRGQIGARRPALGPARGAEPASRRSPGGGSAPGSPPPPRRTATGRPRSAPACAARCAPPAAPPPIPPCSRSSPRASKHTSPGRSGSTAAPDRTPGARAAAPRGRRRRRDRGGRASAAGSGPAPPPGASRDGRRTPPRPARPPPPAASRPAPAPARPGSAAARPGHRGRWRGRSGGSGHRRSSEHMFAQVPDDVRHRAARLTRDSYQSWVTVPAVAATPRFVRSVLHDARPVPSPRPKSNRTPLRVWQTRALTRMAAWEDGPFLLSAAPGAGKTRPALEFARAQLNAGAVACGRRRLPHRAAHPPVGPRRP